MTMTLAQKLAIKGRQMAEDERFTFDELQLAFRNRGMPLEAFAIRDHAERSALSAQPLRYLRSRCPHMAAGK